MDISMQMSGSKNRGHTYKVMHAALQAIRRNGGTLIGIPDNALGEGNPNLLSSPEFAGGLADAPVCAGLVTLSSMAGYDNALAFGHDGSTLSHALKSYVPPSGVPHTMSVIVEMTDGLAPSWGVGGATGGTSPFAIVGNGQLPATGGAEYVVTLISGNTYRVAWTFIPSGSVGNNGVYKYAANNSRTFKVTGYKLERGSVATPYTPQSVLRQRGTYQDSTGTMPLTAVGEVLGLMTDRLGTVGPNVFSDATSCTFAGESVRVSPGVYRVYSSAGVYSAVSVSGGLQQNKTYKLRFYQDNAVAGSLAIDGPAGAIISVIGGGIGWKEFIVTMTSVVSLTIKRSSGETDIQISNVTIEELTGNHATQPTPANKPTLVQVPKRLGVEMIASQDLTTWTSGGAFGNWAGTTSTATTITTTGTNGGRYVRLPCTPGKTYTFAALVTAGTGQGAVAIAYGTSGNVLISEQTSLFTGAGVARCTTVAPANAVFVEFVVRGGTSGQTVTFASLSAGEVLEWTNAISFDGSNDFLQTGIATGTGGWLCAAVNVTDSNSTFFCSGAGSNVQKGVWMYRTAVDDRLNFLVGDGTLVSSMPTALVIPANTPTVIDAGWTDVWQMIAVNGVETSKVRTNGSASPPPNPLRIGAYTDGVTHAMNGSGTAFLHCQTVPTEAERDIIRKWMAQTNRAPYWGELPTLSLDFVSGDYLISNGEV